MKNKLLLSVAILLVSNVFSQGIKDLKIKKNEGETAVASNSTNTSPGANQYELAEQFFNSATKYNFTRCPNGNSFSVSSTMMSKGEPDMRDKFFSNLKRNENGKITEFEYNGKSTYNTVYTPNESAYPTFFKSNQGMIVFLGEYAIFTKEIVSSAEEIDRKFSSSCSVSNVWHKDAKVLGSMNTEQFKKMLKDYFNEAAVKVAEVREQEKLLKEKIEAENRAKYTTKGKEVVSFEIKATDKPVYQGTDVSFDLAIKLKDGKVMSAANGDLIYLDEFDIKFTGLPISYKSQTLMDMPVLKGSTITIPTEVAVTGDQIVLTITSKHHPKLTATHKFTLAYDKPVILNYDGVSQSTASYMMNAGGLRIEIKEVKHAITKETLLEYRVFSKESGNLIRHFKTLVETNVNVSLRGAKGWRSDGRRASRDGGPGGDVKIIVDPSVKSYNLNINNPGGAGEGTALTGRDGKVEKVNQKVTW
jgi:hypothetical protein